MEIFYALLQNITFEGFDFVMALEGDVEVDEGEGEEDVEPTDTSPWAGTDRDYTYEEVTDIRVWEWNLGPQHSRIWVYQSDCKL